LTTRAPLVIAPSMNIAMLEAAAVERNFARLREDGAIVLHGVPSQEVAEAPSMRTTWTGAAAAPGEVAATIDALRAAGVLRRARTDVASASSWDAMYRAVAGGVTRSDGLPLAPWVADTCDDDIAALLGDAGASTRLLDIGTGLGQIARHAAQRGYRVTATDISDVGLRLARQRALRELDIVWLRDDICATALINDYDVIVDRATLHTLPRGRVHAWAASVQRLLAPGGRLILKTHRDGVPNVTSGWTPDAIAALLPQLELVSASDAELPGVMGPAPVPSVLALFRRR
jgi:2-polyprenyl-3-methyl-5-hydroxy-6-metoxy-1,4-benzoquinol methylase